MKTVSLLFLSSLLSSTLAAPAIVWKNDADSSTATSPQRTSRQLHAKDLFSTMMVVDDDDNSSSVVFVLARGADGSESLSTLAAAGALPQVETKYQMAHSIHHHVAGLESRDSMVRDCGKDNAMVVTLGELSSKLSGSVPDASTITAEEGTMMSKQDKYAVKRARDISSAKVWIVEVDPRVDSVALDNAIVSAIDNDSISNVILTAVRSHDEVKHERTMIKHRRMTEMPTATSTKGSGRRRLEEQDNNNNNGENQQDNNNNQDNDMTGVYYVSMTPNILAGILFTLFFATIAYTGITCMSMIAGQDVYVKKMPSVGREA